jgi:hypothetical protein
MALNLTTFPKKKFSLFRTGLPEGAAARMHPYVGGSETPVPDGGASQGITSESVTSLARAVESARLSLVFGGARLVNLADLDADKRVQVCWQVVKASDRKHAAALGLGVHVRSLLIGLFVETLHANLRFDALVPGQQRALTSLTDADLVRVVTRLRPDVVSDLKTRLQERGLEYPENPYVLSENYSVLVDRDLQDIPAVAALVGDASFGVGTSAKLQELVFESLKVYPPTTDWVSGALQSLGANSKSAFVPGGLDALGLSVMFTVIRKDDRLWQRVGPAVEYARRMFLTFGGRVAPDFQKLSDQVPWHVLGKAYEKHLEFQHPEDCFNAYAPYRGIFTEGEPITKDEFYRNVGVLFMRLQDPAYKVPATLFTDLTSADFEKKFDFKSQWVSLSLMRAKMQEAYVKLAPAGYTALPAFFNARSEHGQLVGLGRVLSSAPLAMYFFDPKHEMYLGNLASKESMSYFQMSPQAVVSGEVEFTPADDMEVRRLCGVLQVFKDNLLSVPYTLVERLFGFGHSMEQFGMPSASVVTFLRALPAEVKPYSPVSVVVRLLGPAISANDFSDASLEDSVRNVLKLTMLPYWQGEGMAVSERGVIINDFMRALDQCSDVKAMFELVSGPEYQMNRVMFNDLLKSLGEEPLGKDEVSFSYGADEREDLDSLLRVPLGLCFLDKRLEPSPVEILKAGAYFEQVGKSPDDFWRGHMDSLESRVETRPLPVRTSGKGSRMLDKECLASGYLRAYGYVLGKPESEPLPSLSLGFVKEGCVWDRTEAWRNASEGLFMFEQHVGRSLGGSDMGCVGDFLKLTAACYPEHQAFFMAGAELADVCLKPVASGSLEIRPDVLECLRSNMAMVRGAGVSVDEPSWSSRGVVDLSIS